MQHIHGASASSSSSSDTINPWRVKLAIVMPIVPRCSKRWWHNLPHFDTVTLFAWSSPTAANQPSIGWQGRLKGDFPAAFLD